jgi:hypothetical protein
VVLDGVRLPEQLELQFLLRATALVLVVERGLRRNLQAFTRDPDRERPLGQK